jgi:hypothetical protein
MVLFGGLSFSIFYIAFLAVSLSTFQKIAVILVVIPATMAYRVRCGHIGHEAGHDWEQVFNMDELSR